MLFLVHTGEARVVCFFRVKTCGEKQTSACVKRTGFGSVCLFLLNYLSSVKTFFSVGLNFLYPIFDSSSS